MKISSGGWTVSTGKGDRHYINYDASEDGNGVGVMHPEQLSKANGCGMYGWEVMKDLAVAILMLEKEKQKKQSILNIIDQPK